MKNVVEQLNLVLSMEVFNNAIQDYAVALVVFLVLLVGLAAVKRAVIYHLTKLARKTASDFDDFLVILLSKIGWPLFSVIAINVAVSFIVMPQTAREMIRYVTLFIITIRAIQLVQDIIQYSVNKVMVKRIGSDNASSQAMVKSVVWIVKWVLWALGAVFILDNLGINISALVAGIGIGGIAVAMASQAVLGDAFSALSIYLDKPFEVGDFIIIDDSMGTVQHIGLKTTRLLSLSGEQLVFSNSDLTKSRVKNYKRMQTRRVVFKVGVTYQTPLEKVEKIPLMIREILLNAQVKVDRVHFQSFGDFALMYEVAYYVLSADYNVYMDKQQEINLAMMKAFERERIEFAYPTQTLFVRNEKGG